MTNLNSALSQPRNCLSKEAQKLEKRVFRLTGQAIKKFNLISNNDRILVALSGGKDSWVLLHVLAELKKRAPIHFEIIAANIDQGFSGFRQDVIETELHKMGVEHYLSFFDISKLIDEKNKNNAIPCALCSRLRRGHLYGLAEKLNCNKIALGHHLDDFIETFLLNSFFIGTLGAMSPKLYADDGKHIVIRPLVYVQESEIIDYIKHLNLPIVCCQCPLMCGSAPGTNHKRKMVKNLLNQLEKTVPNIKQSLISSLGNIKKDHLLDTNLWTNQDLQ